MSAKTGVEKSVDVFADTDDINLVATRCVECVVLLSKHS